MLSDNSEDYGGLARSTQADEEDGAGADARAPGGQQVHEWPVTRHWRSEEGYGPYQR